jgi:hypothetical protein
MKNENGSMVASGVYLFLTGSGQKGKVAVIK